MQLIDEGRIYRKVATIADLPLGTGMKVSVEQDDIALFNLKGEIYAINDLCPHRGAPLSEGLLEDGKVFCPWHCFDFNLQTGESQMVPHLRVATYPVKVENGDIFILY